MIFKKILLIFFAAFFDFYEFILIEFNVPKIDNISPTLDLRLGCITTIFSSLICTFALQFKVGKHHKFSLISLSVCLMITIILEIIFKPNDISLGTFILIIFLIFIYLISITFTDCTERYLANYNFINPFLILITEGIFELIMATFYSINSSPFKEIIRQYEQNTASNFILFIFLLILYLILSAALNSYKNFVMLFIHLWLDQ